MSLEQLIAERDIYRQLVKFSRAMDDRDWETMQSLTVADFRADLGMGEIQGRAAVIEFIRSFLDNCGTTQHILGNIIIDVVGDAATSQSYVSDMHLGKNPHNELHFRTLGNYSDNWIKVGDTWLMSERVKHNRATLGSMDVFNP